MNPSAVRAKKHLGQHFLNDENIAQQIVEALDCGVAYVNTLEIGPGMGVLTKYLVAAMVGGDAKHRQVSPLPVRTGTGGLGRVPIAIGRGEVSVVEIDRESIAYLQKNFPQLKDRIINRDFLQLNLAELFSEPVAIIGNFPYNISTQILFKVLEHRDLVPLVVGMFQKEVAVRIAAPPGNKDYGIISVFLQAFYDIEYLFTVEPHVFIPPPKVKSGVIRLIRNKNQKLKCDEVLFWKVVKTAFNQRRKTLRNALKSLTQKTDLPFLDLRAERLSWQDFEALTLRIEQKNDE
ncbi:MAG: 16S rRNA (adenine(1518)-N(6)/adenine(1519)-N(6))-dimethyltransferase RsmA [Bacteroidia bacterium]